MNKKFLGITALAALILAGCTGNTPTPEPTPEPPAPEPTPSDPTLDTLKARLAALGDSVSGTLTLKADALSDLSEDQTTNFYQNNRYSFLEHVGGVAAYQVGTDLGYYMVYDTSETETPAFEGEWGRKYGALADFQAGELISSLSESVVAGSGIVYTKAKDLFTVTNMDLAAEMAERLGYDLVLGAYPQKVEIVISDASKVVFKAYASQLDSKPAAIAEVHSDASAEYNVLTTWLGEQTAFPTSGTDADTLFWNFIKGQNWTSTKSFSTLPVEGLFYGYFLETCKMTKTSMNVIYDEDSWESEPSEIGMVTYTYISQSNSVGAANAGVYGWQSNGTTDYATIAEDCTKDEPQYFNGPIKTQNTDPFWCAPGYLNAYTACAYSYTALITDEVYSEYGKAYRGVPTAANLEYFCRLGEMLDLYQRAERLDADDDGEPDVDPETGAPLYAFGGYEISSMDFIDCYPLWEDDADASVDAPSQFMFVCEFEGDYIKVNSTTHIGTVVDSGHQKVAILDSEGGTTVNEYAPILKNWIEDVTVTLQETGTIELDEGETTTLHGSTNPAGYAEDCQYVSAAPQVTVDADTGVVTGVVPGTTTTVSYTLNDGAYASVNVHVNYKDTVIEAVAGPHQVVVGNTLDLSTLISSVKYASDSSDVDPTKWYLSYSITEGAELATLDGSELTAGETAGSVTVRVSRGEASFVDIVITIAAE